MKSKVGSVISQLLLLLLINESHCFNLDVNNYIRHEGQNGSMFGFSVALHQEQQRSWVIVGAPKTQLPPPSDVTQSGAVYRCDFSDDNRCTILPFDSLGNNRNERNEQIDTKDNQWFGATVTSAGIDGPLVACAPRYVYHQNNPRKAERNEPVGTCWIAKDNFRKYEEFSPCRTVYWGFHRQGSCQAGFTAAINKEGDRVFIGAPGSRYWQGQVYSINADAVYPYKPATGLGAFGDGGQMYSNNPKNKVYSTDEGNANEDNSYIGYSSTTGDFTGDGLQGIAVGMPRGANLLGKVLIFSWNLTSHFNITGEQIGAYFGYSMCSIDVDGDNLDDLIIGAPMHTEPNNEGKYETGRVYIIYQSKYNKFQEVETREGVKSKGRFGLSVAALGDINLDGFGDFAVGAPYDGPFGQGAVYVYHGSRNGPLKKHSQVIFAEDVIGTEHLSTFGFSVSGGIDLDGNQYPDMVVGAYEANRVIVFRSRPVVVMDAYTIFESENKLISLENKTCTLPVSNNVVSCTTINSCLKYKGINLPATLDIEISWVLDSKKAKTSRMFFSNDEGKNIRNSTMQLQRGKEECRQDTVYMADEIKDKFTPLEIEMKYQIRKAPVSSPSVARNRRKILEPVLDENRGTIQRDSIKIQQHCGEDNICIPDLSLSVKTNDNYLLGTNEPLTVDVSISNVGEDAFESNFYLIVPPELDYMSTKKMIGSGKSSFICTVPSAVNNNILKCDIGNPLPAGKLVNFKVFFEPTKRDGKASMVPFYEFYMEANSTNEEAIQRKSDNVIKKRIAISVESDFSISGRSMRTELHYDVSKYKEFKNFTHESEIGPHVVHIYDIHNNGTSNIEEIEISINWPAETLDGQPLMYLMSQPETSGNIVCDQTQFANPNGLKQSQVLEGRSFLDINRVPTRQGKFAFYKDDVSVGASSSYFGSSNRPFRTGDGQFKHRFRRTVRETPFKVNDPLCRTTRCVNVRCVVGPLEKNDGALVALRTRLVANTLHKLGDGKEVKLSTMAIGRITKLPYVNEPTNGTKEHKIFITAIPDAAATRDVVPPTN